MRAVLFDIDGTLVDVRGLEPWLLEERTDYDTYHQLVRQAPPIPWVVEQARTWAQIEDVKLVVATGRGEEYEKTTLEWLEEHNVPFDELEMRKQGDRRSVPKVKEEIVKGFQYAGYQFVMAYEDHPEFVRTLRDHLGIPTVQVPGFPAGFKMPSKDDLRESFWGDGGLADQVYAEMLRAIDKHKMPQTPISPKMSDLEKFIILSEEVGEVARALTYDEGSEKDKKKELLEVMAMAAMWRMTPEA